MQRGSAECSTEHCFKVLDFKTSSQLGKCGIPLQPLASPLFSSALLRAVKTKTHPTFPFFFLSPLPHQLKRVFDRLEPVCTSFLPSKSNTMHPHFPIDDPKYSYILILSFLSGSLFCPPPLPFFLPSHPRRIFYFPTVDTFCY
jgi:hypothetical protein